MKFTKGLVLFLLFLSVSPTQADDGGFYFKKLWNLIHSRHFTSVEQVLPALPGEFKENFVLMYHSNSRHRGATFSQPRIVMHDKLGKMVIAVARSSDQINGDVIEVIENIDSKSDFAFHQIQFAKDGALAPIPLGGESCVACHRANPSPNWEPYPTWPGAYGSNSLMAGLERSEFQSFIESLKSKTDPKMARYQSLALGPSTGLEQLASNNQSFAMALGDLNKKRIVSVFQDSIKKHPEFKQLLVPMAMLSKNCTEDAASIVPLAFRSKLTEPFKTYRDQAAQTVLNHAIQDSQVAYELAEGSAPPQETSWESGSETAFFIQAKSFVGIGYLMKYAMGIDPEVYGMQAVQYTGHPNGAVESASVYSSNDSLSLIENDLIGYDLAFMSCEDLKSKLK